MNKFVPYALAFVCLVVSFILIGPPFASGYFYTSDQAVQVLMAYSPHLPEGFFFWGQNRLGSLLPFLSYPLAQLIPPLWAVSIMQYLSLAISYVLLSKRLESLLAKLTLAFTLFLPPIAFVEIAMVAHPYSMQVLLLAVSLWAYEKVTAQPTLKWGLLAGFSLVLGLWLNELHAFLCIALAVVQVCKTADLTVRNKSQMNLQYTLPKKVTFLVLGAMVGALMVSLLKYSVDNGQSYASVFSSQPLESFSIIATKIWRQLVYIETTLGDTLFAIVCFLTAAVTLWVFVTQIRRATLGNGLIVAGLLTLVFCIVSQWVQINNYASRYFSLSYFMLMYGALLNERLYPKYLKPAWFGTSVAGFVALLTFPPTFMPSRVKQMQGIETIGDALVVADYWMAYASASLAPDKITPLVFEGQQLRNPWALDSILTKKTIYFLEILTDPQQRLDSIEEQLGYTFIRTSPVRKMNECVNGASYKVQLLDLTLDVNSANHQAGNIVEDPFALNNKGWISGPDAKQNPHYTMFGPYVKLLPGAYNAEYYVKAPKDGLLDETVVLDIVADQGQRVIASKELTLRQIMGDGYAQINLPFEIKNEIVNGTEFRVFVKSTTPVTTSHIKVTQLRKAVH